MSGVSHKQWTWFKCTLHSYRLIPVQLKRWKLVFIWCFCDPYPLSTKCICTLARAYATDGMICLIWSSSTYKSNCASGSQKGRARHLFLKNNSVIFSINCRCVFTTNKRCAWWNWKSRESETHSNPATEVCALEHLNRPERTNWNSNKEKEEGNHLWTSQLYIVCLVTCQLGREVSTRGLACYWTPSGLCTPVDGCSRHPSAES
jgi:hypothetical protein